MLDDDSTTIRRKDRIGEDRIGEDRILPTGVRAPAVVPAEKVSSKETWGAYSEAYLRRYGTEPVRNASVNAKLVQFVKRVGEGEAPLVAGFYLTHNDAFYVRLGHPVGQLLKDAEKLRTEWATGRRMTATTARQVDRTQHNLSVLDALKAGLAEGRGDE